MLFVRTFVIFLFLVTVRCSPLPKYSDVVSNIKNEDETRFPNGTVIGKCIYLDREGDPVHVKYYADKNSYGVELKSIKVSGPSQKLNKIVPYTNLNHIPTSLNEPDQTNIKDVGNKKYVHFDDHNSRYQKSKNYNTYTDSIREADKTFGDYDIAQRYSESKDPDYETFVANRLKNIPDNIAKKKNPFSNKNRRLLRNAGWKCLHDYD